MRHSPIIRFREIIFLECSVLMSFWSCLTDGVQQDEYGPILPSDSLKRDFRNPKKGCLYIYPTRERVWRDLALNPSQSRYTRLLQSNTTDLWLESMPSSDLLPVMFNGIIFLVFFALLHPKVTKTLRSGVIKLGSDLKNDLYSGFQCVSGVLSCL